MESSIAKTDGIKNAYLCDETDRNLIELKDDEMLDRDVLQTLKKHLKDVDESGFQADCLKKSKLKIHQFGEDIKSANEFIGALQVLDITLKKILLEARKMDEDFLQTKQQDQAVIFKIEQYVTTCSFMGMELFDCTMSTDFGKKHMSFEISSPMEFVAQGDFASVIGYLEDKREEIKQKLCAIHAIISEDGDEKPSYEQDYSQSFSPKDFLKMF